MVRSTRRRGSVFLFAVLAILLVTGAVVLASGARTGPLLREARYRRATDRALALAEAGVLSARGALAEEGVAAGDLEVEGAPLGDGWVDVALAPAEAPGEYVVTARGHVVDPLGSGRDERLTRRVRARLRVVEPGALPAVVSWEAR